MRKKLLILAAWCVLAGQAAGQVGSPVYLTRPITVTSGMITITGPTTVTIGNQPVTVVQSGAVTVVATTPLTITGGAVSIAGQPLTVTYSATPQVKSVIVDPLVNTSVAYIVPNAGAGGNISWGSNNNGLLVNAMLTTANGPGTFTNLLAQNDSSDNVGTSGNANCLLVNNMARIWGSGASFNRLREVDAVSNTQTALGVQSAAAPDYSQVPVTYTATGAVTYGPFYPMAANHLFTYTTTGSITAAAVSWFSSPDGVVIDATNGLLANSTLASFNGSFVKPLANVPARYIISKVTITTLGGTNVIVNEQDGR